jgi:hypothetical protein
VTEEFEGGINAVFHYLDDHATADEIRYFLMAVESRAAQWKFRADTLSHQKYQAVFVPENGKELVN